MGGGAGEIAVGTCSSSSSATISNNIASPMMPMAILSQVRGLVGVKLEKPCLMMLGGLARGARRTGGGAAASSSGSRPAPARCGHVHSRVPCDIQTQHMHVSIPPKALDLCPRPACPFPCTYPLPSACSVRTRSIHSFLPGHQHEKRTRVAPHARHCQPPYQCTSLGRPILWLNASGSALGLDRPRRYLI